jgi:hypothetical protein
MRRAFSGRQGRSKAAKTGAARNIIISLSNVIGGSIKPALNVKTIY